MTYQEACLRLDNHANLPNVQLAEEESICHALWKATHSKTLTNLDALVADVILCLKAVNQEWNGPIPSESTISLGGQVDRRVAYAMSLIFCDSLGFLRRWERDGLLSSKERSSVLEAIYRIAYGWDSVLAGDIDDILEGSELY
jgi:hypothetical protein